MERDPCEAHHRAWHIDAAAVIVTLSKQNSGCLQGRLGDYQHLKARFALIKSVNNSHRYHCCWAWCQTFILLVIT